MGLLGELALWSALLFAGWSLAAAYAGASTPPNALITSAERGLRATLVFALLALAGFLAALATHDFALRQVAEVSSRNLPPAYVLVALWASDAGAPLLWNAVVAATGNALATRERPRTIIVVALLLLAGIAFQLVAANPFARVEWVPPDGAGLRGELQLPSALVWPLLVYSGFFVAVVSAVIAESVKSREAARICHSLLVVAWSLLTAGMLGGTWWWFGVSAWSDAWLLQPVRNGSLVAWSALTALLLRMRGAADTPLRWRTWLVAALCIAAAFGVRSELTDGIGSFMGAGWWAVAAALAAVTAFFAIAGGTTNLRQLVGKRSGTTSPAPLAATAAGIVLILSAVSATYTRADHRARVEPGAELGLRDAFGRTWVFSGAGVSHYDVLNRRVVAVTLSAHRNGVRAGLLTSEMRQHVDSRGAPSLVPVIVPGSITTFSQSIQVALLEAGDDQPVQIHVSFQPLVALLWLGGVLLLGGGTFFFVRDRMGTAWSN